MKKKVLVASFFAILMLMLPFTGVAEKEYADDFEFNRNSDMGMSEGELDFVTFNDQSPPVDMMYMLGENALGQVFFEILEYLDDLLENLGLDNLENSEQVVLTEEQLNSIATSLEENSEVILGKLKGTMGVLDAAGEDANTGTTSVENEIVTDGKEIDDETNLGYEGDMSEFENLEEYEPLPGGGGLFRKILEWIVGSWTPGSLIGGLIRQISSANISRLGYINGIADFYVYRHELEDEFKEALWPDVTRAEVVEETIFVYWYLKSGITVDFNVNSFIDNELPVKLRDIIENSTRQWIIKGLGIRQKFWEEYIQPIYEEYIMPFLLEYGILWVQTSLLEFMNQKVYWGKGPLNKMGEAFNSFINTIRIQGGKERRRARFANFTSLVGIISRLTISGLGYLVFMSINGTKIYKITESPEMEEYLKNRVKAWNNHWRACKDFVRWLTSWPWRGPVSINGTAIEYDGNDPLWAYCKKDKYPDDALPLNAEGYFEGLKFETSDELPPWGLHKCVTIVTDGNTDVMVGDLDEGDLSDFNMEAWIQNRLLVGSFSSGNVTIIANFSSGGGDIPGYIVSQNNEMVAQEAYETVEAATQEQTQPR